MEAEVRVGDANQLGSTSSSFQGFDVGLKGKPKKKSSPSPFPTLGEPTGQRAPTPGVRFGFPRTDAPGAGLEGALGEAVVPGVVIPEDVQQPTQLHLETES